MSAMTDTPKADEKSKEEGTPAGVIEMLEEDDEFEVQHPPPPLFAFPRWSHLTIAAAPLLAPAWCPLPPSELRAASSLPFDDAQNPVESRVPRARCRVERSRARVDL